MKERLVYIDQMKGIAILLVVMGHLIGYNTECDAAFAFIYSFHMPLFFMISGYLGFKTTNIDSFKKYGLFLKKKFITILLPFLVWNMIAEKFFLQTVWHVPALNDLNDTFIFFNRLWFLKTLFIIFVFYGLTHWISQKYAQRKAGVFVDIFSLLVLVACMIGGIIMIHEIFFSSLLLYILFFYAGMFISKYRWIENMTMNHYVFAGSVVLFLTLIGHWDPEGGNLDKIYKCIIAPMSYIIVMNICRRIAWNPKISSQFELFGKYSLAIYIVHFYLVIFMNYEPVVAMNPNINSMIVFILSAVVAAVVGYLCIGFAKIIECAPILDFFMFGKRPKV